MSARDSLDSQTNRGGRNPWLLLGGSLLIGLALALLLLGGDLFGLSPTRTESPKLQQLPSPDEERPNGNVLASGGFIEEGDIAPDFALDDLDGNTHQLEAHRGQPVVLNFWATWCAPCRVEMPELQAAFSRHQDSDLTILAINFDEPPDTVQRFFYDEMGLTFTPLLDEKGLVTEQYGIFNFPTSIFVGRDGVVSAVHYGPMVREQIESYLADILPTQQ